MSNYCKTCGCDIGDSFLMTCDLCYRKKKEGEALSNNSNSSISSSNYSSSTTSYHSQTNPFERMGSGVQFGFLIVLQVLALPILLITFLRHPILSIGKAIRVIISALILYPMVLIAPITDSIILALWIISFGFINLSKMVVIGYSESLYNWITNDGEFWDLE